MDSSANVSRESLYRQHATTQHRISRIDCQAKHARFWLRLNWLENQCQNKHQTFSFDLISSAFFLFVQLQRRNGIFLVQFIKFGINKCRIKGTLAN